MVQKIDAPEKNVDFHQLSSITFNPFSLYDPGMMDKYVRGEASQNTGAVDTYFSSQVGVSEIGTSKRGTKELCYFPVF